jgi:hypothetical protein
MHRGTSDRAMSGPSIAIAGWACVVLAIALTACRDGKGQRFEYPIRACDADEEHDCVGLVVELDSDLYAQGDPIIVTATTVSYDIRVPGAENISDARFSPEYSSRLFEFVLVDGQGQAVPMSEEGNRLRLGSTSRLVVTLDRGSPHPESFRIDSWFELSEPGTYTLTLKQYRLFPKTFGETPEETEMGQIEIVGNPVTFTRLP